jgi:hypothetical protein
MYDKVKMVTMFRERFLPTTVDQANSIYCRKFTKNMPGRPSLSPIRHPTEKISEFINLHQRQHVEDLPSYLKDTTDYLNKTPSSGLPDHILLVAMDVISIYTNIPHDEGIEAFREVWNNRINQMNHSFNNFMFNGEQYLEIIGTANGTKMALSYADIFMGRLKRRLLYHSPPKPLSWLRFIDNIEMKSVDGHESLNDFIDMANSFHNSIKFTVDISTSKNRFLDTTATLTNGEIEFNLHTKPTDYHLYLMPSSCHHPILSKVCHPHPSHSLSYQLPGTRKYPQKAPH